MTSQNGADTNDGMAASPALYRSTRDATPADGVDFADALLRGIAPDGGLYMPTAWPTLPADTTVPGQTYAAMARAAMAPFLGDALPAGAQDRALTRLTAGFDHPAVTPPVQLEPG